VQHFGRGLGAFATAALLYAGAALVGLALRQPPTREARLRRSDMPRLLAMAALGAVIGPVALAWGLQHTSGSSASLMLSLEAAFTVLLAWRLYGETLDRRVALAMALLLAGGLALVLEQSQVGRVQLLGLLAVLAATAAWGIDNTLSRAVAERDPSQVVLAVGAAGYGLSLRLYLLAQREFGAGRTGSVFAFAPFIGALAALAMGERSSSWLLAAGGVLLHLAESHAHEHTHETLDHEHAHTHDDGHHLHTHAEMPTGPHSHWHQHAPQRHVHPHVPDVHHQHRHSLLLIGVRAHFFVDSFCSF
jgi:drug/metabolite transporter (DMT)-like permease